MEEKDLWMKKLKERLEDYSEPVPPSGWEALEKELMRPSAKKKVIPFRNRWMTAAAAAVLLAAVSSVSLYFLGTPAADDIRNTQLPELAVVPDILPAPDQPDAKGQGIEPSVRKRSDNRLAQTSKREAEPMEALRPDDDMSAPNESKEPSAPDAETHPDNVPAKQVEAVAEEPQPTADRRQQRVKKETYLPSASALLNQTSRQSSSKGKWAMGVSVANAGGATSKMETGVTGYSMSRVNMVSVSNGLMDIPDGHTLVFEEGVPYLRQVSNVVDIKHHQPISFGLSVRRNLSKGFSLETGLTYTWLSSDAQLANNERSVEQNLHYLGIPLRANWNFLDRKLFTFYVSGGGMIEKCVYGKFGSEKQTVKPLQFSVAGAVGAQVNITRRFGIYAEPGIAYFFDDGSDVQTIRKENQLNFNIQAGLRLTY